MIVFHGVELLTDPEIKACFVTSTRLDGREFCLDFLRWEWMKLCLRTSWRMLVASRGRPFAWPAIVNMLWVGVRGAVWP